MKNFAPLLLLAAALAGCATFDKNEITSVRGRGVPPAIVAKLDTGRPLTPSDVIELHRYRVPDPWVVRQLEACDVDSLVTRRDIVAMRSAGVAPQVVDATLNASDRFQDRYRYPARYDSAWGYGAGFGDPYYDSYPNGYGPYPYGYGYGASFIVPLGGGHYRHHR